MAILKIKDGNGNIVEVPALKGDKGDAPVKGVDYWTAEDKADIKSYVNQQISNSGSSHTHDNKNVLDSITADKLNEWSEFTSGGASPTTIDSVYDDTDGVYTFYGAVEEPYPYDTDGAVLQFKVDGFVNQFLFRMDGTIVMRAKIDGAWGEWKDVSSNKVTKIHCSYDDNVSTISADMGTILYKGDGVLDSVYVYSGLVSANINTGTNDYIWYKLVTEDAMKDYVNQQLGVIENGAY